MKEAIQRFQKLFKRARKAGLKEPTAMTLATADAKGRPSSRMVLLKKVDERGFVFYTNLDSRKGRQLAANRSAALCFFWDLLMEQVIIEGRVEHISDRQADAYWASRPRESQIASYTSLQSRPLKNRKTLEIQFSRCRALFKGKKIPRPARWSGFRVIPNRIEFWKARPNRLNERILYRKARRGWGMTPLYP